MSGTSGGSIAILGQATSSGTDVYGQSGSGHGVHGVGTSQVATGVYGTTTSSGAGTGVEGHGKVGRRGIGEVGAINAQYGVWGTGGAIGVKGDGPTGVYGSGSTVAIHSQGKFYQTGGVFEAHPTSTVWTTNKPATVKLADGTPVKLFAEEATEVFFGDYGTGQLQNGRARVALDLEFAQTVTIDAAHPIKVFVQLEGDCNGVFVTHKSGSGFEVVELGGGGSNEAFSYRVVAKRKHYEDERLASEEEDTAFNARMHARAWPELQLQDAARRAPSDASPRFERVAGDAISARH